MHLVAVTSMHDVMREFAAKLGDFVCLVPHTDDSRWREYHNTVASASKGIGAIRYSEALSPGAVVALAFESEADMAKWRDETGLLTYGFARR